MPRKLREGVGVAVTLLVGALGTGCESRTARIVDTELRHKPAWGRWAAWCLGRGPD